MKRKPYTREFKIETVKLVIEGDTNGFVDRLKNWYKRSKRGVGEVPAGMLFRSGIILLESTGML